MSPKSRNTLRLLKSVLKTQQLPKAAVGMINIVSTPRKI
jgi:hypothetical protein